jgi:hypothetical protein
MEDVSAQEPILLVGCALCDRLHEPLCALDCNSICAGCAERLARPAFEILGPHLLPDGELR